MVCTEDKADQSFQEQWAEYQRTKDVHIRNAMTQQYSYIVKCIALKIVGHYSFFNYMEDLVNEGIIALIDSFDKFNPNKNVKFETYASIKIRGAMIDFIRKQDGFSRRLKNIAKTLSEAKGEMANRLGREPVDAEMAEYLQVSLKEYEKMLTQANTLTVLSFEEMVYEKGMEAIPLYNDNESARVPEQVALDNELRDVLAQSVELLNDKERLVVSLYYKEQMKIKDISVILGIGASRVSQIHSSALKKLKEHMTEYYNH